MRSDADHPPAPPTCARNVLSSPPPPPPPSTTPSGRHFRRLQTAHYMSSDANFWMKLLMGDKVRIHGVVELRIASVLFWNCADITILPGGMYRSTWALCFYPHQAVAAALWSCYITASHAEDEHCRCHGGKKHAHCASRRPPRCRRSRFERIGSPPDPSRHPPLHPQRNPWRSARPPSALR